MNKIELYINEQLADLATDTEVRINLKAHELSELSTVWSSYTNTFYLPLTQRNDAIFGFTKDSRVASGMPYQVNNIKLVQNGVELISSGVMSLTVIKDRYEISIYEALDGFYSKITDKYISEIDLPSEVGVFDDTYIDSKRNSLSGVECPVMDYGNMDITPEIDIKLPFYLPSFSYKTILEAIFDEAGYTSLLRQLDFIDPDNSYGRLSLPFGRDKFEYSTKWVDARSFYAATEPGTLLFSAGGDTQRVKFPIEQENYNQQGWYDHESNYQVPVRTYDVSIKTFSVKLNFIVSGMGGGDTLGLRVFYGEGTTPAAGFPVNYPTGFPGPGTFSNGTYSVNLNFGALVPNSLNAWNIHVYFESTGPGGSTSVQILTGEFRAIIDTVPAVLSGGIPGLIYFPGMLPEIKQSDFMKDFITRYFLSSYEKNSVINFRSFEKIISDESGALDLTGSRATEIKDWQYFKGLGYSQVNNFSYANKLFGTGKLLINNFALNKSNDVITSIFNSLPTNLVNGISIAAALFYDATSVLQTDMKLKPGASLVMLRDANSSDPTVKYSGTTRTDYQVAYFIDPISPQAPQMSWTYFINLNGASLVKALQRIKLIYRYYYLTDMQIQQFSFHKLAFDTDSLYLVNSIDDYVPKKPTRIQMLKITYPETVPFNITHASFGAGLTTVYGASTYTVDWLSPPFVSHYVWSLTAGGGFGAGDNVTPGYNTVKVRVTKTNNAGLSQGNTTIVFTVNSVVIATRTFTVGQLIDFVFDFGPFSADTPICTFTITET